MDSATAIALHTGARMPVLGLGTWELTNDTPGTIEAAVGLGYRLIDTACDYGSQRGIGEAIRRGGIKRDSIYLTAKIEETDDAYQATRNYLDEMQTDYADLMLIHRPPPGGAGEELWRSLMRAREDGLTRDIGVSNYSTALLDALIDATGEVPVVNQIEWTPFGHSREMLAYCQARGIVIQAYSPLTRTRRLHDKTLTAIASKYGKSPAQLLIRWSLQIGTVPLPKANQQYHLQEDIAVFDFEIREEDMAALNGLNEHYSALGATVQYV
jgi:diketogulonate reductase-like aldo/keto reductase